jgi:hypothetical protein
MHPYKSIVSIVVLVLLALCQGCAGDSLPGIATEQRAAVLTETPLASNAFVDSIGVNLHMTYGGTPYDTDFSKWAPILSASGIEHVRDAICLSALSFCQVVSARMNQLSATGIRFDLLTSLKDTAQYDASYVQTMGLNGVEAIEGPNECDTGLYCPSDWKSTEAAWQKTLYSLRSPTVSVIGPSMVTQAGYALFGDLSGFMDVGNIHDYVGTAPPETVSGLQDHLQWVTAMSGNKPIWATETGYSTNSQNVPQVVQERYIPRALLEDLRCGVMRTYVYQLFDYGTDDGTYMGLLNANYTPKPAWTRLEQLIAFFKDEGSSPRSPVTYAIRNDTLHSLHHVLFQRSDGTYLLAIWLAASAYDASSHTVVNPSQETVSIALPPAVSSATQMQFLDNGVEKSVQLSAAGGVVSVPISSLVSVVTFKI